MNNFSPIQVLETPLTYKKGISLKVKRDDLITPAPSGNKWRKLKYNLEQLLCLEKPKLLTFGGSYSNHLYAVAAAGKRYQIPTIGVVRGERTAPFSATLAFAESCGMHLHFVDRTTYRQRNTPAFINELKQQFDANYVLPEGGTNNLAIKGCAELITEIEEQDHLPDYIAVPCGTGGTVSGLIVGMQNRGRVIGFSALKGDFLQKEVSDLLEQYDATISYNNWEINTDYHFGGYAKFDQSLLDFINKFKEEHAIQLDPIYTGKLFKGIFDLIEKDYFPKGSSVLAVHTGGLQGLTGFKQRYGEVLI